jgi:hypothetical protein
MKKVILFGIGFNGRKMVEAYRKYGACFHIAAIADNQSELTVYEGIPVIKPEDIGGYEYDEIWITTIYHKEIKKQLKENLYADESVIRHVEYPIPFLEGQIYQKYSEELRGKKLCCNQQMQKVIDYVSGNEVRMYCYPFFDEYADRDFDIFQDENCGLYYGIYMGRKMYLSRKMDNKKKAEVYFRYNCMEQDRRSPHCYMTHDFSIEQDSVGIDVGAAEGVLALSVIDKVKHIYLVETDPDWCEALKYTFADYKDKVTIVSAYASDVDGNGQIRLDTEFADKKIDFIKMDIEGAEVSALRGAVSLLQTNFPKLAVCTYHNAEDDRKIKQILEDIGYNSLKNSEGYVICTGDWEMEHLEDVDFRRALLFAERTE